MDYYNLTGGFLSKEEVLLAVLIKSPALDAPSLALVL